MILTTVRGAALTSVDAALALLLDGLEPVAPAFEPLAAALGAVSALTDPSALAQPPCDEASIDGYAFRSLDLVGASAYAPLVPSGPLIFVESGEAMPGGCDCVLDPGCVDDTGPLPQVLGEALPGEGVRPRGVDVPAGQRLIEARRPIRAADLLLARRAGLTELPLRRPRLLVVDIDHESPGLTAEFVAESAQADGASVGRNSAEPTIQAVGAALDAERCDVIVLVGGTGRGRRDVVAEALAARGILLAHGIALEPGRTTAIGRLGTIPVVALPGAPDAALGAYWSLVRPVLDRLAGRAPRRGIVRPLARKITSSVGVSQIVLLGQPGDAWLPLATGVLPLACLCDAVAWTRVAADCEGHGEGTPIEGALIA